MQGVCFRVNSPSVIYEKFEDELVAINLDTGAYHSLVGAAADAFVLLAEEATAGELAEALSGRYAAPAEEIERALLPFLAKLREEELVSAVETRTPRGPLRLPDDEGSRPFVPPELEAYHDLQSLFLLDPIHEVGEEGWPQAGSDDSQA